MWHGIGRRRWAVRYSDRGDIWHVDLNPIAGREQAGPRPVLVISPRNFNRLGTPLCVPITGGGQIARYAGFTVTLMGAGTKTTGMILCNQVRALDLENRKGRFVEHVPSTIVDEVLAKIQTLLE
jgi:mRNA-degrading endonuclease toxin of MazEF toxin-antitoxin module